MVYILEVNLGWTWWAFSLHADSSCSHLEGHCTTQSISVFRILSTFVRKYHFYHFVKLSHGPLGSKYKFFHFNRRQRDMLYHITKTSYVIAGSWDGISLTIKWIWWNNLSEPILFIKNYPKRCYVISTKAISRSPELKAQKS